MVPVFYKSESAVLDMKEGWIKIIRKNGILYIWHDLCF